MLMVQRPQVEASRLRRDLRIAPPPQTVAGAGQERTFRWFKFASRETTALYTTEVVSHQWLFRHRKIY